MDQDKEKQPKEKGQQPAEEQSAEVSKEDHGTVDARKVKRPKKTLWVVIGLVVAVLAALAWVWFALGDDANAPTQGDSQPVISSYEECVAAGYPVMESYPEQCAVPEGETFTRQLSEEEQANLDAANQQEQDDAGAPENDDVNQYGEITITNVKEGIIDDYDRAYDGWGDRVVVVTINAENTTDDSVYYYVEQFRGELASGEIINSHVPEYDDELFVQFTLAPDGARIAKLAFRTDEAVDKLIWQPQNASADDQLEYELNQTAG